ncbi:MAG: TonB-dependent receptor [Phenylobacterium sp.]|uniref:TonB-dependent receptor n=1 Tax=Phenylobacterium sp. TaxID=1871053 RepID=UPI0027334D10|nr:TonB-dependent receptor [Phenylobacterium sp.]MDP3749382.1 TonB-dependent receptor [Phenylobacterium sp.]
MTNQRDRRLLAGVSVLAVCWGVAATASAQSTGAATASDETQIEEVVVTGIRGSIIKSLEAKRTADSVVDVITAEDIGKLPDQNIAESMSRISGVAITRKDGEGNTFSIRGIDLNRVEINGRAFTGPTQDATPSLQAINPEILSGLEVIKSPTADQTEGSLGGTVNLRTRRPLDGTKDFVASARVQGVYGNKVDELGYRASGLVAKQFNDGTFGVSAALAYGSIKALGEGFQTGGWAESPANSGIYRPNRLVSQIEYRDDERITANGAMQWKPDSQTEVNLEATYSNFQVRRDLQYYQTLLPGVAVAPQPGATILADGTVSKATYNGVTLRPLVYESHTDFESLNIGVSGRREIGRLTISADASYSQGTGSDGQTGSPFTFVFVNSPGNVVNASYDLSTSNIHPDVVLASNFDRKNPMNYQLFSLFDGENRSDNTGYDGKIDLRYDLDAGFVKAIKGGVRGEKVSLGATNPQTTPAVNTTTAAGRAILAAADKNGDGVIRANELPSLNYNNQYGDFLPGIAGDFDRNFLTGVVDAEAGRRDIGVGGPEAAPLSEKDVDQTSKAVYLMADLEGDLGSIPFRANVGARYVWTERTSAGFVAGATAGTFVRTSVTANFKHLLPSANVSFDLTENLILRLAAAKVIARPPLSQVGAGIVVNQVNFSATAGNPLLKPFEATQMDATLEWYFAEASLLSFAVFNKKIDSFTTQTVTSEIVPGNERFGPFTVSRPTNGEDGKVRGFEVGYQHALRFLPAPFDGLGVQVNYTYADSETPVPNALKPGSTLPLTNLSEHSYNLVAYYENDRLSARLAYTYRDDFLNTVQAKNLGGSNYTDAYGQLDASGSYNLNDRFRLTFEATGLNRPVARKYIGTANRITETYINDTRITFGIAGTF